MLIVYYYKYMLGMPVLVEKRTQNNARLGKKMISLKRLDGPLVVRSLILCCIVLVLRHYYDEV